MFMTRCTALLVSIALLAYTGAIAQQIPPEIANSTPEQRAAAQTAAMEKKLSLTADQVPKVEAINLQAAQKMEPVLKGTEGPLAKLRTSKAVEQEKETALQGVLTPAQFQQFLAAREELKQAVEQRLKAKQAGGASP